MNHTEPRRVVVNADDFGMSPRTNQGIIEAFERGYISSATIMANMPAFRQACELVHRHQLHGKIGLHLNLTEGRPLTKAIAGSPKFCNANGFLLPHRIVLRLSSADARLLSDEIAAQHEACLRQGIQPTHWDSHNHLHWQPGIARVVMRMAKHFGVRGVRIGRNCGPLLGGKSLIKRVLTPVYRKARNIPLRSKGLARTDYCGSFVDTRDLLQTTTRSVEVVVHPLVDDKGRLMDLEYGDFVSMIAALSIRPEEMCSFASL